MSNEALNVLDKRRTEIRDYIRVLMDKKETIKNEEFENSLHLQEMNSKLTEIEKAFILVQGKLNEQSS